MKIAICGGANSKTYTPDQIEKCTRLGKFLAGLNTELVTGGCPGFPYYIGRAAIDAGAKITGFSPSTSKQEHTDVINYPTDAVTDWHFADKKYENQSEAFLRREVEMVTYADAVIAMGGNWGTFTEIILFFAIKKPMILIEEFDGAVLAFNDTHKKFSGGDFNPNVLDDSLIIRVKTVDDAIVAIAKNWQK